MAKCFLLLSLVLLLGCRQDPLNLSEYPVDYEIQVDLGISFPPVADDEQRTFTAPILEELAVKAIRIGENWSLREPTKGNFNWAPLDKRIAWAEVHNLEILLTIQSNGPDWACSDLRNEKSCVYKNNKDFEQYITKLLQRYPDQIAKIQYGNEWMADGWYIGDGAQFTEAHNILYEAVQTYSPATKVVLGGFTTISLRFLAGCDGLVDQFFDDEGIEYDRAFLDDNCSSTEFVSVLDKIEFVLENTQYEEVDIHLYDDAEQWSAYYTAIASRVDQPIIVTEFGGPNLNIEPDEESYQAERLFTYIQQINELGVGEAYFFKLVEGSANEAHAKSGLLRGKSLKRKASFDVFKRFSNP